MRRYIPILALLLGFSSCGLPPTPAERAKERQQEQSVQPAPTRAQIETAWKDSVWLWPLAGYQAGEGILCQPGEMIGKWKNQIRLFLTAPEGTPVLCPEEATVGTMSILYMYSRPKPFTRAVGAPFRGRTYDEAVSEMKTETEDIPPKYLTVHTALNIGSRKVYISGLMRERGLPEGTRLNRGDTLGTLHYGYCGFEEPCLCIYIDRFNRPADPMTPFGIPTTFVAPKRPTTMQILFRRVLWVAVPVLLIGLVLLVIFRLRDRRRIAYFRRLKEELTSGLQIRPNLSDSDAEVLSDSPQVCQSDSLKEEVCQSDSLKKDTPEDPAPSSWADAYHRRIEACAQRFWTMPSAGFLHAAAGDPAYTLTAKQATALAHDLTDAFRDIARDIRSTSVKVNNDEMLYCLLSTLRLPTSVMARCLHVTGSTLRGRKTRLKAKIPEELYNVIFQ